MAQDIKRVKSSGNPIEASKDLTLSAQSVEWFQQKGQLCRQTDFCQQIARLAKYWSQTILFDKKVFGKSYIFELIAVQAALEEEEEAKRSRSTSTYVGALRRFWQKIQGIRQSRVIFTDNFHESDIPPEIRRQTPLLINPVNRYQNQLDSEVVPPEFFKTFADCASNSLARLSASQGPHPARGDVESMALIELFKPQPLLYQFENGKFKMDQFLVGPQQWNGKLPEESINRDPWSDYDRQKHFLNIILVNLSSYLKLYVWRFPNATSREMQINAQKVIDAMRGKTCNWVSSTEKHESRTLSFFVPTKNGEAQRISFDLKRFYLT